MKPLIDLMQPQIGLRLCPIDLTQSRTDAKLPRVGMRFRHIDVKENQIDPGLRRISLTGVPGATNIEIRAGRG